MSFMKKQRSRRQPTGRHTGRKGTLGRTRVFRKRRKLGFSLFCALMVLALAGLGAASLSGSFPSTATEESVATVDAPTPAEAPEPVKDTRARAEQEAEQEAAEERRAAEEREGAQRAAAAAPEDPTTYLTVPKLGVYSHTVQNDSSEEALAQGAIKVPGTGFPWEEKDTNTYIAGHRIGWPGTESDYQFYDLPLMQQGDEVILEDSEGRVYTYRVTEIFAVSPSDTWVAEPIPGRDVVSLQTCTETPNDWWTIGPSLYAGGPESGRLVVRADRVS
jgi:LPXTG-site transpeptidase (sortase) family protein